MQHVLQPASPQPVPGHVMLGQIAAGSQITALSSQLGAESVLVASEAPCMRCYAWAMQRNAAQQSQAIVRTLWTRSLPAQHKLLTSAQSGGGALAASASPSRPWIAIWRWQSAALRDQVPPRSLTNADGDVDLEWLHCASPAGSLQLHSNATSSHNSSPDTLAATCADGRVRLWVDTSLADTLPASLLTASYSNQTGRPATGARGRSMCLAHVLSFPGAAPAGCQKLTATWAAADTQNTCGHHRNVLWLVATRISVATEGSAEASTDAARIGHHAHEGPFEDHGGVQLLPRADELCVWAVQVQAGAVHCQQGGSESVEGKRAGRHTAVWGGPRVSATLWGCDHHHVRPLLRSQQDVLSFAWTFMACMHCTHVWCMLHAALYAESRFSPLYFNQSYLKACPCLAACLEP